jgi:hypothetical protein
VEPLFNNGVKGFRIFHDSEYFREKQYFHPQNDVIDRWTKAIKVHAQYFDVNKKYERMQMLGKGKFSSVYLCQLQEL